MTHFARGDIASEDDRDSEVSTDAIANQDAQAGIGQQCSYPNRGSAATSKFFRSNSLELLCQQLRNIMSCNLNMHEEISSGTEDFWKALEFG